MDRLLDGKCGIVTGANGGIGRALVSELTLHGADVFACIREKNEEFNQYCTRLEQETGTRIQIVCLDIRKERQMSALIAEVKAKKSSIDFLINNAGIMKQALFRMTSSSMMEELMEVNTFGALRLIQRVYPILVNGKMPSVVNISSTAAIDCDAGQTAYASSKAALNAVTRVLARECGEKNIRVNAILPGPTETGMLAQNIKMPSLGRILEQSCLKRCARPEEIARAAVFLCSDLASYITGQTIRVDGGMFGGSC